jgi:glycosyltransferase involved in cell wall biosynthesis
VVLGVDVSRLLGPRTGVGRAVEYLLKAWSRQDLPFERVELFSPAPVEDAVEDERFRLNVLPSRGPGIWWETIRLGRQAAALDLLFAPYSLPVGYRGHSVVENWGILDGEHRPKLTEVRRRGHRWHFAASARAADAVIAVSDVVRDDLVRWYGVPSEKITIIQPGISEHFRPAHSGEEAEIERTVEVVLGRQAPFLIFVGKLSPRRHLPELLEAFARVGRSRPDLNLLLVGPNSWGLPLTQLIADAGCRDSVRHVHHLEHDTLAALYRGAAALVLPTTKEGWSLPIREALACGCPVVTVDGPWLAVDGARDVVLTVPSPSVELLEEAMRRMLDDNALRARLREEGLRCASHFPSHEERGRRVMELLAETSRRR